MHLGFCSIGFTISNQHARSWQSVIDVSIAAFCGAKINFDIVLRSLLCTYIVQPFRRTDSSGLSCFCVQHKQIDIAIALCYGRPYDYHREESSCNVLTIVSVTCLHSYCQCVIGCISLHYGVHQELVFTFSKMAYTFLTKSLIRTTCVSIDDVYCAIRCMLATYHIKQFLK